MRKIKQNIVSDFIQLDNFRIVYVAPAKVCAQCVHLSQGGENGSGILYACVREIEQNIVSDFIQLDNFRIVYVAPTKVCAQCVHLYQG